MQLCAIVFTIDADKDNQITNPNPEKPPTNCSQVKRLHSAVYV